MIAEFFSQDKSMLDVELKAEVDVMDADAASKNGDGVQDTGGSYT